MRLDARIIHADAGMSEMTRRSIKLGRPIKLGGAQSATPHDLFHDPPGAPLLNPKALGRMLR